MLIAWEPKKEMPGKQMSARCYLASVALTGALCFLFCSCGGGSSSSGPPPPPPSPDFNLVVSPSLLPVTLGTNGPPALISVQSQNGFGGSVTVSIKGLPEGSTSSPASPFTVGPNGSQEVRFSVPGSTAIGSATVQFSATSGSLSKQASLAVDIRPAPAIRTYQDGETLYVEADSGAEAARVGMLTSWGGAIVEISLNGINYVNHNDTGRQVQVGLWDGNANYSNGSWGWSMSQGGDHYLNGSPLLAQTIGPDFVYIKTQPLYWLPDLFGGDSAHPIPGDVYVEQWVSPVPAYSRAFKVHYKITHFGNDTHANQPQEFPSVYVNRGFDSFVYYPGFLPWTYGALQHYAMPPLPQISPLLPTFEQWGAYADANETGLTVYTPGSYPYSTGFNATGDSPEGTNDFAPFTVFSWYPNAVLESDIYVVAGPVAEARPVIYQLHDASSKPSAFPPWGVFEVPQSGQTVSGSTVVVGGWTFGTSQVMSLDVFLDGVAVGTATYGSPRPDIPKAYPGIPDTNSGFQYTLDSTKYTSGRHDLVVKATDAIGNLAVFPTAHITISNP